MSNAYKRKQRQKQTGIAIDIDKCINILINFAKKLKKYRSV